jgi:pyrroline-5-carboxylate reductase
MSPLEAMNLIYELEHSGLDRDQAVQTLQAMVVGHADVIVENKDG